jgi:O-methyltransferase domain
MSNWQLPDVFIAQYLAACNLAAISDKAFDTFRHDPHISTIIENTNKEWADKALDKMGYTPTMVRYMYIHHLIIKLLGRQVLHDVVEIGAGYGGQCKIIKDHNPMCLYTIFDLPEVIALQKRFLDIYNIEVGHYRSPTFIGQSELCLSWCAWSELSLPLRKEYAEKVISKCDHIFICSNYNKEEDRQILLPYFPDLKEYSDDLVNGVLYA